MPPGALALNWGGQALVLDPSGALWWPSQAALLLADLHLGKAHSFRRQGLPVPAGTTGRLLGRLDALLARYPAQQLWVLGDFLHAAPAQDSPAADAFLRWRLARPDLALGLVRGNHDQHAGDPPAAWGLQVVDEPWAWAGLALRHHPSTPPDEAPWVPEVVGHLHPVAVLHGPGRDRLRLPCFCEEPGRLMLPAFGEFTGGLAVAAGPKRQRWVTDGRCVHRVDPLLPPTLAA